MSGIETTRLLAEMQRLAATATQSPAAAETTCSTTARNGR